MTKYTYKNIYTYFLLLSRKELETIKLQWVHAYLGIRNVCSLDKRWILGLGQGKYKMILLYYIALEVRKHPKNGRDHQKHIETDLKGFSEVKSGTIWASE